jgi:hypothetical protein
LAIVTCHQSLVTRDNDNDYEKLADLLFCLEGKKEKRCSKVLKLSSCSIPRMMKGRPTAVIALGGAVKKRAKGRQGHL